MNGKTVMFRNTKLAKFRAVAPSLITNIHMCYTTWVVSISANRHGPQTHSTPVELASGLPV